MKKVLSIVFAMLILLSGLHLSVATHACGGEIAAVKWSFSGEKATCGMENTTHKIPSNDEIAPNCCQDEISAYQIDNNYNPSTFTVKKVVRDLAQVFIIPACLSCPSFNSPVFFSANFPPGNKLQVSHVFLEDICVFRI